MNASSEKGNRGAPSLRGVVATLALRRPFLLLTWLSFVLFWALYAVADQIVVWGSAANLAGVDMPTQFLLLGPEPMLGPPRVAYYLVVLSDSGWVQVNLSGLLVAGVLAVLFGLNLSLVVLLRRNASVNRAKRFGSLLSVVPSLLGIVGGGCCSAPLFYLLLFGSVAAESSGFVFSPYYSILVYASVAMMTFNIWYFGRRWASAKNGPCDGAVCVR